MDYSRCMGRRPMVALGVMTVGVLGASADGAIRFLGIGNDEFRADIDTSYNKLAGCLDDGDFERRVTQQNRMGILDELTAVKNAAMPGDIIIIHYSGHGGTEASTEAGDNPRGIIGTSPDGGATFPDPASDTDVADIINMFGIGVNVLTIFDSCFAGEMVDDVNTDITRGMVLGTSDATCVAPGGSIFLPLWCAALEDLDGNGVPDGDANNDGTLTLGELWGTLDNIEDQGHASNPYAADLGGNDFDAVVWVPAPGAVSLLGVALVFGVRRRR